MIGRFMGSIVLIFHSGCLHLCLQCTGRKRTNRGSEPLRGGLTLTLVSAELFDHFDLFKQNNSPCVYSGAPQVASLSVLFIYF